MNSDNRRTDPRDVVLTLEQVKVMEETRKFHQKLSRRPLVTYILLGILIFFWLLSFIVAPSGSEQGLVCLGAKINFFIDHGQFWRLVSPIFLHFGVLHMVLNGYALYLLGKIVENLYGPRRFLILFMVAGVASIAASYLGSPQMSVGASGAIFGLLGASALVGYKHRSEIPPAFRRFFGRGMVPWIFLNLGLGLFIPGIDNMAHGGGLIGGVAIAWFMKPPVAVGAKEASKGQWRLTLGAVLVSLLALFTFYEMISSALGGAVLDVPPEDEWTEYSDLPTRLKAQVPPGMIRLSNPKIDYGQQFLLKDVGYWVALEREPDKILSSSELMYDLEKELESLDEIDAQSISVSEPEPAILAGRDAILVHIGFKIKGHSGRILTDYYMLPTSTGLVSATCSGEEAIFETFAKWCEEFASSVQYYGGSI